MGTGQQGTDASEGMRMSDERYVPFSVRQGGGEPEAWSGLFEGTPPHLVPSLSTWIYREIDRRSLAGRVQRHLHLDFEGQAATPELIRTLTLASPTLMLDVVDLLLRMNSEFIVAAGNRSHYGDSVEQRQRDDILRDLAGLMMMLSEASSAYAVDMSGVWQLVRRVDPTAEAAVKDVIEGAGHASGLLKSAWRSTFSRDPNPDNAYRDAVLAVESVASALFTPKDEDPSLGKAIRHLADTVGKWSVAGLDDKQQASGETLLGMLRTVWQNDERHVSKGGAPPHGTTQEEAEAVMFLAVTIVQWFERGLVRHNDQSG
jgi:hypothetical protein